MKYPRNYIGASLVPMILGFIKGKTEVDAWLRITGQVAGDDDEDEDESMPAELGHVLEPYIAGKVGEYGGFEVRKVEATIRHPDYPFLGASLDYMGGNVAGDQVDVECKSVEIWKRHEYGAAGSANVPKRVYAQVQQQMGLAGLREAHVGLLVGKTNVEVFCVDFDRALYEETIARLVEWYRLHCIRGVLPEPGSLDDLAALYPKSTPGKHVHVDDALLYLIGRINQANATIVRGVREKELAMLTLLSRMGDAQAVVDSVGQLATWREEMHFDEQSFRADHPVLWEAHARLVLDKGSLERAERKLYAKYKTLPQRGKTATITKRGKAIVAAGAAPVSATTNGTWEEQ